MKKETLFISFSTQKGGMGKTAFTVLVASYLQYKKIKNIAVIDCDYPQHSIAEMRKRDTDLMMKHEYYKQAFYNQVKESNQKAYPVKESSAINAISTAKELINQSETGYDIIFFDLPGTLNTEGVITTLSKMDYIFTPISADRVVLESSLGFSTLLNDNLISVGRSNIKGLYLFWNMVDGREKSELYKAYEKVIHELGLSILKTYIPDTKRFRKELTGQKKIVFRSTLFAADKILMNGSHIDELVDEITHLISL